MTATFAALSCRSGRMSLVVPASSTVTVDYLRGGSEGQGDTVAEATIERLGNRIANVEAMAWQTDRSKPIAAARINFLLERP